ncbi:MAG TPA: hypothetical protein VI078_02845 [bacterium]
MESKIKATEEQRAYAWLLDWGMKIGLLALVVTFGLYLAGVMKPYVPVEALTSGAWKLRLHGTAAAHGADAGKAGHGAEAAKGAAAGPAAEARAPEKATEHQGSEGYLEKFKVPTGWGWISLIGYGDFVNFIGIAFLAGVTVACYLRVIPILFARKDTIYGVIAALEVVVLTLAASGLLKAGH